MNPRFYQIIKKPLMTEKVTGHIANLNQYAFEVDVDANRTEIKEAVEALFKVKVKKVRVLIIRGKVKSFKQSWGKRPNWKKAYVTLAKGEKIELHPGV